MDYTLGFVICSYLITVLCMLVYFFATFQEWRKERENLTKMVYAKSAVEYNMLSNGSRPESRPRNREALYKLEKLKKAQQEVEKFKEGV
jgi:hypothetical protein